MTDFRDDKLEYVQGKDRITVLKGGVYLCEIMNVEKFNEILLGNLNRDTGLTGDTLIELGEFVNRLNEVKDKKNDNTNR